MGLGVNGQNAAADGIAAVAAFLSLHTGAPSTTGANEATGGSPAYARKAVTWAAAASGQRASSGAVTFDVPAGTYYWIGHFSLVTAGTYYGCAPLGGQQPQIGTAANAGDTITSYAHGLVNTDRVILEQFQGVALPTGYSEEVVYFVTGATTDTFTVSLTSGGATVTISTDGELSFTKVIPETFAGQGQLTVPSGSAVIDARGL